MDTQPEAVKLDNWVGVCRKPKECWELYFRCHHIQTLQPIHAEQNASTQLNICVRGEEHIHPIWLWVVKKGKERMCNLRLNLFYCMDLCMWVICEKQQGWCCLFCLDIKGAFSTLWLFFFKSSFPRWFFLFKSFISCVIFPDSVTECESECIPFAVRNLENLHNSYGNQPRVAQCDFLAF